MELHVWGEGTPTPGGFAVPESGSGDAGAETRPAPHPFALGEAQLRAALGEVSNVLWVQDLPASCLSLRLPGSAGAPSPSAESIDIAPGAGIALHTWRTPTVVFKPDDALEWLLSLSQLPHAAATDTASAQFWGRLARRVVEFPARQRFAPDLVRAGAGAFEGWWRAVLNDQDRAELLRYAQSMPAACRCWVSADEREPQPLDLVEGFLRAMVDQLVRDSLKGDELAEAVLDQAREAPSPQARWLATLVGEDRILAGSVEEQNETHNRVRQWLAILDPSGSTHRFRTLLRLHAPGEGESAVAENGGDWLLTFHLQSLEATDVVIDADAISSHVPTSTALLGRPVEDLAERLRIDLAVAGRHFEPLRAVLEEPAPCACRLGLGEAYQFLRHVAPLLTLEGLAVETPEWWGRRRPRLGLKMRLRPAQEAAQARNAGAISEAYSSEDAAAPARATLGIESLVTFDWRLAVGEESVSPDDLRRWVESQQPLARVGGEWMEVDTEAIQEALGFLDRHEATETTLTEALHRAFVVETSPRALPVVDVEAEGWLSGLIAGEGPGQLFRMVAPPAGFVGTLRPYQLRGVSWLDFLDRHRLGACLADDMGLGKTIQLIALLLHERAEGAAVAPTLIVVPMSVVGNWLRELNRFAPSIKVMVHHGLERLSGDAFVEEVGRHDVVISTYGLVHRDLEHLMRVAWHRTVLDEAQNIKNPSAKQSIAVRRLVTARRVGLTGTPIENRLGELWSIMDFLNPALLGSAGEFRRVFASPIERHRDELSAGRLRKLIRPFVLRRAKSDPEVDVDLPEKLEMNVYCNLTREQAALYEQVTAQMLGRIDQAGGIQRRGLVLTAIMRLKQICNHPAQFLGEKRAAAERSGKCDRLLEMLEEVVAEGDHAIVFTQFRQMGDLLVGLMEPHIERPILFLHGGTPEPKRRELVDQFQAGDERHPVLVLSLKAGGVGLNLTAANHVFHFDRWWNPAVEDQATDRAHRIGQSRKVQVHKFVCVGTLEERIDTMLMHKKDLADRIIGGGEEWLTELSTDRLRELFRLSQDAVSD